MRNYKIARRYARALLLLGKEDGNAEIYRDELAELTGLLEKEKILEQAICNPLYETEGRKKVLQAVIDKMELTGMMRTFLLLLFDKGRFGFLTSINEFYQKFADELKGIARATLVSAVQLTDETIDKIESALKQMMGKEVVLKVEQDPELIGGIVTKIGDLVLDGSIKTQLLNMRESLKRGESV